ncbi:MAG: TrkA C-terminal domain-containing protein [Bacteroidota bacterium]
MIALLGQNSLLLLFVVAAIGYGIGSIKVRGNKLGVAAVLFVGLFFGAWDKNLKIDDIVFLLGLSIFVYSIGLSSGPGFMAALRGKGPGNLGFIFLMIVLSGALALGMHFLFGFDAATTGGLFTGSSTNTAALAGLIDSIEKAVGGAEQEGVVESAVVGYSITYPMGVLGGIIGIVLFQRWFKIDYAKEAYELRDQYPTDASISNWTIKISENYNQLITVRDLIKKNRWTATFGRIRRGDDTSLVNWDTVFQPGDRVAVVGKAEDLDEIIELLGEQDEMEITREQSEIEHHRVFISNPEVAGKTVAELNLNEQYAAIITRIRRGDTDLLARGDTVLELGDRIRFVARRKDVQELVKLFGDSYQSLSQINLLSFGLGMALGLLLGMITFSLPGDITFQLGFAGGPLIVALILGALRRTGPIVWTLPYGANLTLRQFGLILLLAAVGIRSGHTFIDTVQGGEAGSIFLAGAIVSIGTAFGILFLGYKLFKIPFSILMGMVANQPAILDFSLTRTDNQLPNEGYAVMFPIALITKIVLVQILFGILN